MFGAWRNYNPAMLSRFIDGADRSWKSWIGKGADRNGNKVGISIDRIINGGSTGGAKAIADHAAFIARSCIDRRAPSHLHDIFLREARLFAKNTSRPPLAREAMANRNPHGCANTSHPKLPATVCPLSYCPYVIFPNRSVPCFGG
jgi:hypothetical protein